MGQKTVKILINHTKLDKFVKGLTVIPIFGIVKEYAETKVYL